jgi:tripartite-type tricarboxylate transporter receptor subunit TctC
MHRFKHQVHTMKTQRLMLGAFIAVVALTAMIGTASAQSPTAPVRMLVPVAAGGPSDQAARLIAKAMSKSLGQDVVVENKPGANGAIGAQALAAAPADGHTVMFALGGMIGLPALMKSPPYASLTEYTALGAVGGNQICLFVHSSLPVSTTQEFVSHARANPDKLSYGTSVPTEYLAATQLIQFTGVRMTRIPYRGSAAMLPDFLEGRVQVGFMPPATGAAHVKTGRLKLLGCNVPQRLAGLPDVPTLAEAGIPSVGARAHHLLLAPAKLPAEAVGRLGAALRKAAFDPGVRAEFERLLIPVEALTPEQTTDAIRDGERVWAKFVHENGILPE